MEAGYHFKNKAIFKGLTSMEYFLRKICFVSLATSVILLFTAVCSMEVRAQEISFDEFMKQVQPLMERANEHVEKKDYQGAEKIYDEAIVLFSRMSKDVQDSQKEISSGLHYNLACYLSLQNKKDAAVGAFQKAVEAGWANYSHAKNDTDLDNIRTNKRFVELMETIRELGDYVSILRKAEKYQNADTTGLPHFTYEASTSSNLKEIRQFFKLDTIAGQGDEISKIINMMTWIHDNIRHDGSNYALCEFDAIDLYNYHKSTGKGINCRHLSIALNEMYLAMGFKSRYVTCLSTNEKDQDCHVINSVYSTTLKKWIWIDPTFNAYVKDENGNLLSIEEVRERLIADRPLVLNEDANWNNQNKQTKAQYLDSYMAKNLYWLQCPVDSRFNPESRYRNTNQTYISLRPSGDKQQKRSYNTRCGVFLGTLIIQICGNGTSTEFLSRDKDACLQLAVWRKRGCSTAESAVGK